MPQKTPATTTTPVASPITRADLGWPGYSTKTRANARTPSTVPCTMARINSVCRTRLKCLVIKSLSLASARVSITPGWFPALPPAPTIMVTNSAITMCLWNMSSNLPMMSAEKDCSSSRNMSHGVRIRICLHRGTFRYSSISRALVWLSVVTVDPESSSSVQMPASQSSLWACFSRNRRSRFSSCSCLTWSRRCSCSACGSCFTSGSARGQPDSSPAADASLTGELSLINLLLSVGLPFGSAM
mmetsp:Transcript_53096/g.127304  ORF Transcript_53096/g.127304 Transcript_53096/m.127304 type:complete len:243 (-) Transcript_53096:85-813(-)